MDCVNHSGVNAAAFCQNCGKALCTACVRSEATGHVFCEPCWTAWKAAQGHYGSAPFAGPYAGAGMPGIGPNPVVAGVLGLIPGVGAMFNGQFLKGFVHVVIFAALITMAHHFGVFGLFIAAWVVYQVFDAYHTAKAKRDGEPLPDPLGINELVNWFEQEFRRSRAYASAPPPGAGPISPPPAPPAAGPAHPQYANPYQEPYQSGHQPPYPPYGGAGFAPGYPPPVPPVAPAPPVQWRRREPIAAIILIALGLLFLLGQFSWHMMQYAWPLVLIGLGVWLVVRRMHDSQALAPVPPTPEAQANPNAEEHPSDENLEGGSR